MNPLDWFVVAGAILGTGMAARYAKNDAWFVGLAVGIFVFVLLWGMGIVHHR